MIMAQLALACDAAKQVKNSKNSKSATFVFLQLAEIFIPNHSSVVSLPRAASG